MFRIFHCILVCIFMLVGASPIPACYVTRPDCPARGEAGCPLAGDTAKATTAQTACPFGAPGVVCEPQPAPLPSAAERLKRFTIEQLLPAALQLPVYVPTLFTALFFRSPAPAGLRPEPYLLAAVPIHHRPPPLFLEQQALLI